MDCNPRVEVIHICVLVQDWIAIRDAKVTQVLFRSTKINETRTTNRKPNTRKTTQQLKDVQLSQPNQKQIHENGCCRKNRGNKSRNFFYIFGCLRKKFVKIDSTPPTQEPAFLDFLILAQYLHMALMQCATWCTRYACFSHREGGLGWLRKGHNWPRNCRPVISDLF